MLKSDLSEKSYRKLLNKILPIILEKGLKSTTMDSVALSLGMSKRTLYELFDSKSEMIKEVMAELERKNQKFYIEAFANSENVMEALVTIFKYNRDFMGSVNVQFFCDMDRLYKDKRVAYDKIREERHKKMLQMFRLGIEQGMFRKDVDFDIQSRMVGLQMEALKRIEELFPPDITIQRVFDSILVGFLRSIASEKGMKILDKLTAELTDKKDL